MEGASPRIHGDYTVPAGGWSTMCTCASPTAANWRTGPLGRDCDGHDGVHATMPGCDVRHHLHWHDDLHYESCGFGGYPLGSWPPYACTRGMGRHGFQPRSSPSPQLQLLIFVSNYLPWIHIELAYLAFLPNMCIHCILLSIPYPVYLLIIAPVVIFYPWTSSILLALMQSSFPLPCNLVIVN